MRGSDGSEKGGGSLCLNVGALEGYLLATNKETTDTGEDDHGTVNGGRKWQNNPILGRCLATWWGLEGDIPKTVMQETVTPEEIRSYSFTSAVWRGFVPHRVELFTWFVLIERMNTKERLSKLGILGPRDDLCALCSKAVESAFHLFIGLSSLGKCGARVVVRPWKVMDHTRHTEATL
ncbi:uncharacterized protein LOC127741510 [Arachis duranensis]|uniref:Uncharacterized protein LOC127741510 n=1 Tax=Arachis duranensis TaxID=130453 RepID=A0A9C6WCI6_ARADU|nr:uncharacterized protein LOC127741510 [Arachis duranensis]